MRVSVFVLVVVSLFWQCSSPKVVSHMTPNTSLNDYSTFGMVAGQKFKKDDTQVVEYIEGAILKEMEARGFDLQLEYDLTVSYQIIMGTDSNTRTGQRVMPYNGRYYRFNTFDIDYYNEGILLIEMRDRKSKKIIWQGSVDMKSNQNSRKKMSIDEFVNLIFTKFPVPELTTVPQS